MAEHDEANAAEQHLEPVRAGDGIDEHAERGVREAEEEGQPRSTRPTRGHAASRTRASTCAVCVAQHAVSRSISSQSAASVKLTRGAQWCTAEARPVRTIRPQLEW